MNYYITNMETHKLELHFEKEDYLALPENLKKEINRNKKTWAYRWWKDRRKAEF